MSGTQVSQAEDYRPAEPLRTRALKRIALEGAVNVSVAVKEAPGASQSGAPVDRINGLQKQRDDYVFEKTGRRPSPPRGR